MKNTTFTEHAIRLQTTRSLNDNEIASVFNRYTYIAQLIDETVYDVLLTSVRTLRNDTLERLRDQAEQLNENTFVELDRIFTTGQCR